MNAKIEPSGVIFTGLCDIQTARCVAREIPNPVTAVWSLPGRRQINVCRPCLDEMILKGEWIVEGARLRQTEVAAFDGERELETL
jgi:hypothetical protein